MAEYDYSRDRFDEAIAQLMTIADTYQKSEVAVEAIVLAAEIWDSPYNPKRSAVNAEQLLASLENQEKGNERIKIAHLSQKVKTNAEKKKNKGYPTGS